MLYMRPFAFKAMLQRYWGRVQAFLEESDVREVRTAASLHNPSTVARCVGVE